MNAKGEGQSDASTQAYRMMKMNDRESREEDDHRERERKGCALRGSQFLPSLSKHLIRGKKNI